MTPETWFEQLTAALTAVGGPTGEVIEATDAERDALLDLARVAAHASERWTAPVSTFLVGAALHALAPEERAAAVRRLVTVLDRAPAQIPDAGG